MSILITGGAGYIGSKLAHKLSKSHKVVIVDNLMYDQWYMVYHALKDCEFINMNVQDMTPAFISSFKTIIPLAALVGATLCDQQPLIAKLINFENIKYICDCATPEQFIIFMNTNSGYGCVPNGICTEETPLNSISLYGKTKDEAEQCVMKHTQSTAFRLATIFGVSYRPRLDLLVNTMTYEAVVKKKIKVFDGNFNRNYIHIDDVVLAIEHAINFPTPFIGEVFNVGNDSINETKFGLAQIIQKIYPCEIEIIHKTDPDQRNYIVSSEKLKQITGLVLKKSLDSGIKDVANLCKHIQPEVNKSMSNV